MKLRNVEISLAKSAIMEDGARRTPDEMNYFLGVDAGGTKTEFVLGDAERELARAVVGSIKRMRVSADIAQASLCQALAELERQTGVPARTITHSCIGAAGNSNPLVADWLRAAFAELVGGQLTLVNDAEIALDDAFHGGRGVLALAGTGAIFAARTRTGDLLRAGGWGPALDDEGSGYWIGMMGLRRCFQAINERRSSALYQAAMEHWNLHSRDELVAYANRQPAPDFPQLAPLFVACAELGDAEASALMRDGGERLAHQTILLIEQMQEAEAPEVCPPPAVACMGSVLVHAKPLRSAFVQALQLYNPAIQVLAEPADAAAGALRRARCAAADESYEAVDNNPRNY
jgi:N-acetylglucosamine kinase-like BadF-type ATPase